MTESNDTAKQWTIASSAVGMLSTLAGLVFTMATADFFKPALKWLPGTLFCIFFLATIFSVVILRLSKRSVLHWTSLICALGLVMSIGLLIVEQRATPPGGSSLGAIAETKIGNSLQQKVLPLDAVQRKELVSRALPQVAAAAAPVPVPAPITSAPLTAPPTPAISLIESVETALKKQDPGKREALAQEAVAKAQDAGTRRTILRAIYRSNDPVLREIVILQTLKALEGKTVPLMTAPSAPPQPQSSQPAVAANEASAKLAGFITGASITIKQVNLETSSFSGLLNTGHQAELHATITIDGLQLASAVTGPGFGAFALQIRLIPQDNFRLTGQATGLGTTTPVEMEIPL